jgi:nucleotide-binding universal stress UspA family protein
MTEKMKILIGYDGSECANGALHDLKRAGLPTEAEVSVVTVADVFLPPPVNEEEEDDDAFPRYVPTGIRKAHEHAAKAVAHARDLANGAKMQLAAWFPEWDLRAEACGDSPAWALIKRSWKWQPDLIVIGSHGHSAFGGRLILGSVSLRVLYEAETTVRVARGSADREKLPVRIIVGVDGSTDSQAALDEVAVRSWPKGSEVRLVAALDTVFTISPLPQEPEILKWFEVNNENDVISLRQVFESLADKLRGLGLTVSVVLKKGDPKLLLIEEAESWNTDSIFVGAKGIRGISRLMLGSVSAAVAARAPCSVEVVRPKQTTR